MFALLFLLLPVYKTLFKPAEVEGLDAGGVVNVLELGVGLEDVQHRAVGLPEELQPRYHHLAVGSLLLSILRHCGKHDALGGCFSLEVSHLRRFHQRHLVGHIQVLRGGVGWVGGSVGGRVGGDDWM